MERAETKWWDRAITRLNSGQLAVVELGIARPKLVMLALLIITVVLGGLIFRVDVDTDPENMLPSSNPVRVLNRSIAEEFGTHNVLALGIVDRRGVLNPETLAKAAGFINEVKGLGRVESEGVVSFASVGGLPTEEYSLEDVTRIANEVAEDPFLGGRGSPGTARPKPSISR